ncbi:hypothetical protein EOS93_10295 [Rhizobium sp. RMa-01]|nr:hypothetical protein BBJ66_05635 [Rhizobium sp. RSm-3]RVU11187.1 hypothetical protein EOS93_10295 [Rhizobium sp. RMa-01]
MKKDSKATAPQDVTEEASAKFRGWEEFGRDGLLRQSISVFLRITEMLYLFVFTQFRTQDRYTVLLELL